ncbi:hypothetical protein IGI04_020934 [Brassica rapa subsp. trilocularis]|uniref:Uncharacterized protein n=1 Tax=Brassica rapa subsp. trilocularis TaxID=1813537 RepID=A0ABQ7MK50_BRACM|nr:hypothetical protein IGI04_020934 [Brassica rapa subsp. trilocularis]
MTNPSEKVVVKWVNDTRGRVCWVILASLCLCGFKQLMEVFKDESQVLYKYVGMSLVSLYVILLVKSLCSETPTITYRSVALVQLLFPIYEFYVGYVMVIIALEISVAYGVVDNDLDEEITASLIAIDMFLHQFYLCF